MKRGDIVSVNQLSPGDRFHKKGSKDGKRFEFIKKESNGKCKSFPDGGKWTEEMRGSTSVVFLRNANDKT